MGGGEGTERLPEALAASNVTERFTTMHLVNAEVRLPDGRVLSIPEVIPSTFPDWLDRVKVLRGELPDRDSPTDAMVSLIASQRLGLDPGDQLTLVSEDGTEIAIDVATVVAVPGQFPSVSGRVFSMVGLGPGFAAAHPELLNEDDVSTNVWLTNGSESVLDFRAEGDRLGFGSVDIEEQDQVTKGVDRLVQVEAIALLAAGLVAAAAGAVVMVQLMRRTTDNAAGPLRTLQALGVTRHGFRLGGALAGLAVGLAGAIVGAAMAVVSSAFTPFGTASVAEPEPGVRIDTAVLVVGIITTVAIVAALSGLIAGHAVRTGHARPRRVRPSLGAIPEPAACGVHFALFPADTGTSDRGRTSLLGLAFVVAVLVAVMNTGLALSSVGDHPALSGGWWDGWIAVDSANSAEAVPAALEASSDVTAYARGGWLGEFVIGDVPVGVMVTDRSTALQPPMTRGRPPRGPDEVALGPTSIERLELDLGDDITFEIEDDDGDPVTVTLAVVGETVFAAPQWFTMAPGEGALVDSSLVERWQPLSAGQPNYLVRLRDGVDGPAAMRALADAVSGPNDSEPAYQFARSPRADIEALTGTVKIPFILAVELVLVAAATLAHQVVTSSRRHRRDLAVLRSLGFTTRQSTEASVAQAATFSVAALVVGLPLGLVIGSFAWRQIAHQLVVIASFPISGSLLVAIIAGLMIMATALGLMVGRGSRHHPPATDLRRE